MKKTIVRISRIIIKPFLRRGLGQKFPLLRNFFYRQFSPLVVRLASPIEIPHGHKLYLPPNGVDYVMEPYEEMETELIEKNLKRGGTFIDIGAGVGYHTVIASRMVGNGGKVIAFEPEPTSFEYLKKNLKKNNCNNVLLYKLGVADRRGKEMFYVYDKIGRSRIEPVNSFLNAFQVRKRFEIEMVRVDDVYQGKAAFIKMDVEGSEYLALQGMRNLMKNNPQVKLISEVPDYKQSEFFKLLQEWGFTIYEINTQNKRLDKIDDPEQFTKEFKNVKRSIGNLFCEK